MKNFNNVVKTCQSIDLTMSYIYIYIYIYIYVLCIYIFWRLEDFNCSFLQPGQPTWHNVHDVLVSWTYSWMITEQKQLIRAITNIQECKSFGNPKDSFTRNWKSNTASPNSLTLPRSIRIKLIWEQPPQYMNHMAHI